MKREVLKQLKCFVYENWLYMLAPLLIVDNGAFVFSG